MMLQYRYHTGAGGGNVCGRRWSQGKRLVSQACGGIGSYWYSLSCSAVGKVIVWVHPAAIKSSMLLVVMALDEECACECECESKEECGASAAAVTIGAIGAAAAATARGALLLAVVLVLLVLVLGAWLWWVMVTLPGRMGVGC